MRCEIALFDAMLNSIRLGSSEWHHPYSHTLRPHGLRVTLTLPLWTCTAIRPFAAQLLVQRSEVGSSKQPTPSSSALRHTDRLLLRLALARLTFSRMSLAFAVQIKSLG